MKKEKTIEEMVEIEEVGVGLIGGLIIGAIIGIIIIMISVDNQRIEGNCVEFYKRNNYITKECEIYKDKLEKSKEND